MLRDRNNSPISNWSPASKLVSITPTDGVDLSALKIRGLYVGVGGDVVVVLLHDAVAVTLLAVPTGSLLPMLVKEVLATGTSADSLVGFI